MNEHCLQEAPDSKSSNQFPKAVSYNSSLKKKKNYLLIYLAVPGLNCSTQDLGSSLWHAGSLVAACELLVASCGI